MDFSYSADEERFRGELRAWLQTNPPGTEPSDPKAWVAYAKGWQKKLDEDGARARAELAAYRVQRDRD